MKEHMDTLKKLQVELAEFFCEDSKTFKMNECFDSLAKFCKKFKEAVSENVKRKEQEVLAEERRILREQEEAKKAKNGKILFFLIDTVFFAKKLQILNFFQYELRNYLFCASILQFTT